MRRQNKIIKCSLTFTIKSSKRYQALDATVFVNKNNTVFEQNKFCRQVFRKNFKINTFPFNNQLKMEQFTENRHFLNYKYFVRQWPAFIKICYSVCEVRHQKIVINLFSETLNFLWNDCLNCKRQTSNTLWSLHPLGNYTT